MNSPTELDKWLARDIVEAFPSYTFDRNHTETLVKEIIVALVVERDKAREKVAKTMIKLGIATGHGDTIEDLLNEWASAYQELVDRLKHE